MLFNKIFMKFRKEERKATKSYDYVECQLGNKAYWLHKVHMDVLEEFPGHFSGKKLLKIRKQREYNSVFNRLQETVTEEFVYESALLEDIKTSQENLKLARKYDYKLMKL